MVFKLLHLWRKGNVKTAKILIIIVKDHDFPYQIFIVTDALHACSRCVLLSPVYSIVYMASFMQFQLNIVYAQLLLIITVIVLVGFMTCDCKYKLLFHNFVHSIGVLLLLLFIGLLLLMLLAQVKCTAFSFFLTPFLFHSLYFTYHICNFSLIWKCKIPLHRISFQQLVCLLW